MHHVEGDRRIAGPGDDAHPRDVFAAKNAHRCVGVAIAGSLAAAASAGATSLAAFAVQNALHLRQKRDELVVVPLLEATGATGVFVDQLTPRRTPRMAGDTLHRHQPQRPEQHLAQMPHGRAGHGWCVERGSSAVSGAHQ